MSKTKLQVLLTLVSQKNIFGSYVLIKVSSYLWILFSKISIIWFIDKPQL